MIDMRMVLGDSSCEQKLLRGKIQGKSVQNCRFQSTRLQARLAFKID